MRNSSSGLGINVLEAPMLQPLLLIPNPVSLSLAVREAMQLPVLSAQQIEYRTLHQQVLTAISRLYPGLSEGWQLGLETQSVYQAMLPTLRTLNSKSGDLVLLISGERSRRWAAFLEHHHIAHTVVDLSHTLASATAEQFTTELVQHLEAIGPVSALLMVHVEPESGLQLPLAVMAKRRSQHAETWCLDASHSFGVEPLNFAGWPLTAVTAISDAALHGPAGLSVLLRAKTNATENNSTAYFSPPSSSLLSALQCALSDLIRIGGTSARRRRYARSQEAIARTFKRYGVFAEGSANAATAMACYSLPGLISREQFAAELLRQGFFISEQGSSDQQRILISVMGDLDDLPLARLQQAIEDILHPISLSVND